MKKIIFLLCCVTLLAACSDNKRYAPKEGRIAVFDTTPTQQATGQVILTKAESFTSWPQPLQNTQNKLPNMAMTDSQTALWSGYVSKNQKLPNRNLPTPIVLTDVLYVLDSAYTLTKIDLTNGQHLWQLDLESDRQGLSLTYSNKTLFALSTDGLLTAVDEEGNQLWQKDFETATRAPLLSDKGTVYLTTAQNQFMALNAKTGKEIWGYQTVRPQTWLTNMASPAKSGNVIVVPFSTGEVMAFEADSGLLLWIQMMVGERPKDLIAVPQIVAAPVIDEGIVYLSGNANLTGAYNLQTGNPLWTSPFGSTLTPVISGNSLFILSNDNQLMAIEKKTGKIFWQRSMSPKKDALWQHLLLINNELVLATEEQWVIIDTLTGETKQTQNKVSATLPVLINQHLLLINNKARATYY